MPEARSQAASLTQMTEYVLPQHANAFGTVFGGQIMAWVDLCGAICAQRHSGHDAVTAFVDDLLFQRPVRVGQVVRIAARITATFRTSMEIEVQVEGEIATTGERWRCVDATLTFVAIDRDAKPVPIPQLQLDTEETRASQAEGELRRKIRLAKKTERPPQG